MAKDRQKWTQREEAVRVNTRVLEDKIRNLEDRLKKTFQKGDKSEFRNASFEVFTQVPRGGRSMQQREYEQVVAHSIEEHTRALEEEGHELRETLKEVFARLQRLSRNIDPDHSPQHHRPEIIELPPLGRRSSYLDLLRRFLATVEERAADLRATPAR
jgi:hypothetical protein